MSHDIQSRRLILELGSGLPKSLISPAKCHAGVPTSTTTSALTNNGVVARGGDGVFISPFGLLEERSSEGNVVDADWSLRLVRGQEEVWDVALITHRCRLFDDLECHGVWMFELYLER